MRTSFFTSILPLFLAVIAFGQAALTNDAVTKMLKAGLGEDIIISTINSQPGNFATGPDDLIALKGAGVSDKIIAAMMAKKSSGKAAPPPVAAPAAPASSGTGPGLVNEVGVYYLKADTWADLPPEVVNFKTGGVLKTIGTAGIVKGDVNGRVNGDHSRTQLKTPVTLLVYTPEGVAIEEYQLLRLRESKDAREFRTVTGGVMHVSGGATRDLVPFESKKMAPRTHQIVLPNIGSGDFGLLPPASSDATSSSGRIGKIYSFRIIE
ncbi:MAG: hypothetical protein LAQ69_06025 [Acidobacteriia bacterium]|nr:hypothetical protein [Terriglobia bacterium]